MIKFHCEITMELTDKSPACTMDLSVNSFIAILGNFRAKYYNKVKFYKRVAKFYYNIVNFIIL